MLDERIRATILAFQRSEITEHLVYRSLAQKAKGRNSEVLKRISDDELRHYNEWKAYTNIEVSPSKLVFLTYLLISRIFGLTFAMKMMEGGERNAEEAYADIISVAPEAEIIVQDETEHEKLLIGMIDEEKIGYIGSMVLGLNDALVELTGALAGLTFTFQNARLVGAAGLITGIAASLSMATSEYLSQRSEKGSRSPLKAAMYTGIAYVLTVILLVAPYFLLGDYRAALAVTVIDAVFVVLFFSFFVSVVKEISFRKMFIEMLLISLGVAAVSFAIGWIANQALNLEI